MFLDLGKFKVNLNDKAKKVELRVQKEEELQILEEAVTLIKKMYPRYTFSVVLDNRFKIDNMNLNEITKMSNHLGQNVKILIQAKEIVERKTKNNKYMYTIVASLPGKRKYISSKAFVEKPLGLKEGKYYILEGKVSTGDARYIKNNQKKLGKEIDYYIALKAIEEYEFQFKNEKKYDISRAELHLHSKYSKNDAFIDVKDVEKAFDENKLHALAITDHGCVSAVVPFVNALKGKYKDTDKKLILGCEFYGYSQDEYNEIVFKEINDASKRIEELKNSEIEIEIAHNEERLKEARDERNIAKRMMDRKTISEEEREQARGEYDEKVSLIDELTKEIKELKNLNKENITEITNLEVQLKQLQEEYGKNNNLNRDHITVLLSSEDEEIDYRGEKLQINKGLVQLYKLVTESYQKHFSAPTDSELKKQGKRPMLPYEVLFSPEVRKYFKITSACAFGKHMKLAVDGKWEEFKEWIKKLDAVEIHPTWNNIYMLTHEDYPNINTLDDLYKLHRKIYETCKEVGVPCIIVSDAHVNDKEDRIFRANFKAGYISAIKKQVGEITSNQTTQDEDFSIDKQPFIMSYDDVIEDYSKQGFTQEEINEMLDNTNKLADSCANAFNITVLPKKLFLPDFPNLDAKKEVPRIVWENAIKKWSTDGTKETIHPKIKARIEEELEAVAKTGFEVLYMIAKWCCDESNKLGYIVGSRGSAGSMIVSYLMGISENNPLPPHYCCKDCHHVEFVETDLVGLDLQDKICPECGCIMEGDGLNIEYFNFIG